jgi:hypothetical protein
MSWHANNRPETKSPQTKVPKPQTKNSKLVSKTQPKIGKY